MSSSDQNIGGVGRETHAMTGVGYMVVAMLIIPIVDGIAKHLSAEFSPLFITWSQYLVACSLILPIGIARYGWRLFPTQDLVALSWRTVFLLAAMTLYFLAISTIPLTLALSAYFVGPLLTLLMSILFLGERLTWLKLTALGLGLVGSLIILEPNGEINTGVLYAFGAGFFFALYLIATRMVAGKNDPMKILIFQYVLGVFLLFPQAALTWNMPGQEVWIFFVCLGVLSSTAHMLSIVAFRYAEASVLAPLVYLELLGSTIVGYLIFKDVPDIKTILGAAFIVSSGLLVLLRRKS